MKNATMPNRKTGRMIVKNLIIMFVLALIAALAMWAWFTSKSTVTADGINVKTVATGVEVSWDDENYYTDLTDIDNSHADDSTVGPAKNVDAKLSMITGNGTSFFLPKLNRVTGTPLLNDDDSWQGEEINEENSKGRYLDVDVYFRSPQPKNVYLAEDSSVFPKDTTKRISDYGNFSRDYICSSVRVAFVDAVNKNTSFIWAPNKNYELSKSSSGFVKLTEKKQEEISVTEHGKLDGGVAEETGKTYYFWTLKNMAVSSYSQVNKGNMSPRKFTYDKTIKYYVAEVSLTMPTYNNVPTIPFFINTNSSSFSDSDVSFDANQSTGQKFYIGNRDFIFDGWNVSDTIYPDGSIIPAGSKVTVKFGYNPSTKLVTVLSYTGTSDWQKEGSDVTTKKTVDYYDLTDGTNIVFANQNNEKALSSIDSTYKKSIAFNDSKKSIINNDSITLGEQFIPIRTGSGYYSTYVFQNVSDKSQYLNITDDEVTISDEKTSFSLSIVNNIDGALIKYGDKYLGYKEGIFTLLSAEDISSTNCVIVFQGLSYNLLTNSEDYETFKYYDSTKKTLVPLDENTSPRLFSTMSNGDKDSFVGNNAIITKLVKQDDSDYYKSHIVMRIWAEGTDRDGLVPLANGVFETSFHFISDKEE